MGHEAHTTPTQGSFPSCCHYFFGSDINLYSRHQVDQPGLLDYSTTCQWFLIPWVSALLTQQCIRSMHFTSKSSPCVCVCTLMGAHTQMPPSAYLNVHRQGTIVRFVSPVSDLPFPGSSHRNAVKLFCSQSLCLTS